MSILIDPIDIPPVPKQPNLSAAVENTTMSFCMHANKQIRETKAKALWITDRLRLEPFSIVDACSIEGIRLIRTAPVKRK